VRCNSDKEELANIIKNQLHVQLTDPINDIDLIFDSLDDDKSGLVSMDEVSAFRPGCIQARQFFSGGAPSSSRVQIRCLAY
jgi:hypothetical protein